MPESISVPPTHLTLWEPLRNRRFRALWLASILSNAGSWAYTVAAQWQMTSLSTSPLMVSLIQVAGNLPLFLFLLPAGALSDLVDRRQMLMLAQAMLILTPLLLGITMWAGYAPPWILILATFVIGTASAFSAPVWQTLVPEMVAPEQLVSAVALNSVSINTSRSVGPAIGGAVVAAFGAAAGFFLSAVASVSGFYVAYRQPKAGSSGFTSAERVVDAMIGGLRFIHYSPRLRAILIREATFVFFAGALWALLPAMARVELGMGVAGYGMLMGCFGVGALCSAVVIPRLQGILTGNQLAIPSTIFFSVACVVPALADQATVVFTALFLGGAGWTAMLVIFNTGMQTQAPKWVRGRAVAEQGLVLFGMLTLGAAVWGQLAEHAGLKTTFLVAGLGLLVTLVLHCRYALTIGEGDNFDEAPAANWDHRQIEISPDDGPILVMLSYRINTNEISNYLTAMRLLRDVRHRTGASRWDLARDLTDPRCYTESYVMSSWADHELQLGRMTQMDRKVWETARGFDERREPAVFHGLLEHTLE
jgi:MFS family permease